MPNQKQNKDKFQEKYYQWCHTHASDFSHTTPTCSRLNVETDIREQKQELIRLIKYQAIQEVQPPTKKRDADSPRESADCG